MSKKKKTAFLFLAILAELIVQAFKVDASNYFRQQHPSLCGFGQANPCAEPVPSEVIASGMLEYYGLSPLRYAVVQVEG